MNGLLVYLIMDKPYFEALVMFNSVLHTVLLYSEYPRACVRWSLIVFWPPNLPLIFCCATLTVHVYQHLNMSKFLTLPNEILVKIAQELWQEDLHERRHEDHENLPFWISGDEVERGALFRDFPEAASRTHAERQKLVEHSALSAHRHGSRRRN